MDLSLSCVPQFLNILVHYLVDFYFSVLPNSLLSLFGFVVVFLIFLREVPGSIPGRGSYLRQVSLH